MKAAVREALDAKDPFDFLCLLEAVYGYRSPDDFPRLPDEGRMAVSLRCFYQCFANGGYAQVIAELASWLHEIARNLEKVGAQPFAGEVQRIIGLAGDRGFNLTNEDHVIALEEIDNYHQAAMIRDLPLLPQVSARLRDYVGRHADAF